jgi:hypothetical protein
MEPTMPRTLHVLVPAALAVAILTPGVSAAQSPPTPTGGPMPIIPPPGSPGGDPTVQPK